MEGDKVLEVSDLSDGFPYMPNLSKGVAYTPKYGACDPLMGDQFQRETPFRLATAFFRWTRAVGGELTLAGGNLLTLFGGAPDTAGSGAAAGAGATATLTRADTNAFDQGGVAKQGTKFIAVAVSVQPLAAFTVVTGANCTDTTSVRRRQQWFTGGTDYAAECFRLMFDSITPQLQHGESSACQYNLGPLSHWLSSSPISESFRPQAGIPGAFTYLAVPDVSGNRNAGDNFNLILRNSVGLQVDSDAINPTVVGFDFVTPIRFSLVGFPVCDDGSSGAACAPGSGGALSAMVERRLAKMEAMMQSAVDRAGVGAPALGDGKSAGRRY